MGAYMPMADRALIADEHTAIEALLTEFYWRLDHPASGTVADLFTADGSIVTPRFKLEGQAAIAQWFADRPQRTTRHSWSNLRLAGSADGQVIIDAYLTTAAASAGTDSAEAELMISETSDRVVRDDSGVWRFASRRLTTVFEGRLLSSKAHQS
jgi:SnoaL-like protein